jgi:hypothetical protein
MAEEVLDLDDVHAGIEEQGSGGGAEGMRGVDAVSRARVVAPLLFFERVGQQAVPKRMPDQRKFLKLRGRVIYHALAIRQTNRTPSAGRIQLVFKWSRAPAASSFGSV